MNGNICCILSESDSNKILNNQFKILNVNLKSIIKVLARNNNVKKIYLGVVKKKSNQNNKFLIKKIIDFYTIKICDYIDDFTLSLKGQKSGSEFELDPKDWNSFKSKLISNIEMFQNSKGFYTDTFIDDFESEDLEIDMFLRLSGIKIERGKILNNYSKLGILSLHHGDFTLNRGSGVGFWEIVYGENSGITVQFLSNELDGGTVITVSRLKTLSIPKQNRENIYAHTSPTLEIAINKIYKFGGDINKIKNHNFINKPYFKKILKKPFFIFRIFISFSLLIRTIICFKFVSIIWKILNLRKEFVRSGRWGVAITNNPNLRFDNWKHIQEPIRGIQPRVDWHADPFFIKIKDYTFLLTEKWIQKESKGVIFYNQILENNAQIDLSEGDILLRNSNHLSFPFCFSRNGNSYMIPENGNNGCWLYELQVIKNKNGSIFLKANKLRQLLTAPAKDPCLIRVNNLDYLLVSELDDFSSQVLHAFVSDDITQNSLKKHPDSPVVIDHSIGRAAGRIFYDENLKKYIRPTQIGEKEYGGGIKFSEILLSPDNILLIPLDLDLVVEENNNCFEKTHHIDKFSNLIAMDYKLKNNFF